MSDTFSFSRLGKLINKQFFENARLYAFSTLAIVGLLAISFAFWFEMAGPNYNEDGTYMMFFLGLFLGGGVFAAMSFNMLGNRDKGIYWLTLPATHLEKLVCTILFTTVAFTIIYCLSFFLVKSVTIMLLTEYIKSNPGSSYVKANNLGNEGSLVMRYFMCAFIAIQAFYILGSVYFSRYAFVITSVVTAALIFSFAYYVHLLEDILPDNSSWNLVSLREYNENREDGYRLYSISPAITSFLKYLLQFAWAPIFWFITWVRLREKEI
ncbi:hypothetical protein EXU57_19115 [Segetibacter sp. 3557_3]|uniref:hypothetical protein n=1 Tax=Segetibacter sp. 3557_3 TaxID=2547429 RepID=UPI0010587914|nr:hypothetical protein [Segetibacter sp. 3557_3]TDH21615.1 hypothetical protein EXU57_19115 [Segetibacter sp. 3557_3]